MENNNKMTVFVKKWFLKATFIPYGFAFLYQCLMYFVTQFTIKNRIAHDLTSDFDRSVPVITSFVYIYLGCYIFWIINILLAGKVSKTHFYKTVTTSLICITVCGAVYIIYPTTLIRPEIPKDFNYLLMKFLYWVDEPLNLFPSIHCLVSWLCYIAVRGKKAYPIYYRIFSLIYAVLICISTQVLKQHYIVDLISGVILVELVWFLVNKFNLHVFFETRFEKINRRFKINWEQD